MTFLSPLEIFMPAIDVYMALAEAIHDQDETCNANYDIPFSECGTREYDIELAVRVLVGLNAEGWRLVRKPAGTAEMGL